jgi:hypothetical protein
LILVKKAISWCRSQSEERREMKKTKRYGRWSALVWVEMLCLAVASPAVSQQGTLDPVVVDVIEMLRAGVDEGVIAQWLDSTDRRPADVGRQGVIALTEAGASESLMTTLLQGVETHSAESAARSKPAGQEAPPATGSVETLIHLRAKQAFVDEDEPDSPRAQPWGVYLYLDGELVAWSKPSLAGEPVASRRLISVGDHELRVVLQRYEDLRGGWLYESLSVPTQVVFQARAGAPLEIEVEVKRIWGLWRDRKDGGPLSYVVRQGVEVIAEHEGTGGNPDRWQPVCEDVEANLANSPKVPKRFRGALNRCIRWADLWIGKGRSTSRSEILAELARFDFEPSTR